MTNHGAIFMKGNNQINKVLLTKEGLNQLQKEFEELVKQRRPKAVVRVATARDQGDLSENSEYAAANDDLAFIDGRIVELEEILREAKIIRTNHSKTAVDVGSSVTLHINGKKDNFLVVGEWEANPKEKKISHSSPLGKALLGKKVGDIIEVEAPAGKLHYKIVKIE